MTVVHASLAGPRAMRWVAIITVASLRPTLARNHGAVDVPLDHTTGLPASGSSWPVLARALPDKGEGALG